MPNFIRLKLLKEPEEATIQELCTKARQKLILREICPVDDWSREGLIEMSSEISEKFLTVLTKMSGNQNSLENRIIALTQKLNSPQQNSSNNYKDNEQQTWRGNFRGRTYQNRGNRGYSNNQRHQNRNYQNQGSKNYQNNQNCGRYGNNFNRGSYRGRKNFRGNNSGNFSNNYNKNSHNSNFQQQGYHNNETTINTGNSGGHIETTAFAQKVCESCSYPNHTSSNCEARRKSSIRGGQIPFNSHPKKLIKPQTSASPEKNINLTLHTTDNILETSEQTTHPEKTLTNNIEIIEVILLEGENLMYIPLKFENKLRRRSLIDTGACANAMPADFLKKLER